MDELSENGNYEFAFLKVDIAGHSKITADCPRLECEEVFDAFEMYVERCVSQHEGMIWSWQGDGGLCAFWGVSLSPTNLARNAYQAARSIIAGLGDFNVNNPKLSRYGHSVRVRIAAHSGNARYRGRGALGRIHSEAINFVAHLESKRTHENSISISREIWRELSPEMRDRFVSIGTFEGKAIYTDDKEHRDQFEPDEPHLITGEDALYDESIKIIQRPNIERLWTTGLSGPKSGPIVGPEREWVDQKNKLLRENPALEYRSIVSINSEEDLDRVLHELEEIKAQTNSLVSCLLYTPPSINVFICHSHDSRELLIGLYTNLAPERMDTCIRITGLRAIERIVGWYINYLWPRAIPLKDKILSIEENGGKVRSILQAKSSLELSQLQSDIMQKNQVNE